MTLTLTFVENEGATDEGIVSAVEMTAIVDEINLKADHVSSIYVSATAAPGSGDGENGWYWLKADTMSFYGPKAAGAWPTATSMVGDSAYETWLSSGNTGTEDEFLLSLIGEDGTSFTVQAVTPTFLDPEDEDPTVLYLLY
jgi:hypothetical protein